MPAGAAFQAIFDGIVDMRVFAGRAVTSDRRQTKARISEPTASRRRRSLISWRAFFVACVLLVAPLTIAAGQPEATRPTGAPVRLAVLVVFDQMRGDYPFRWEALFGEGGFRRFLRDGAAYQNCHYPYAFTVTGAGHASLATGTSPRVHGVVGNDWYERSTGEAVYCATEARYKTVPPSESGSRDLTDSGSGSGWPGRLLAPTLADALKDATQGKSHVVSLSFKDRGAILPGGQHPDACYWFETSSGRFVTSTYYRDRLHPVVEAFNAKRPADAWFGRPWVRLRPDIDYARYSGPDDGPGEAGGVAQGVTFPHAMTGGLDKAGGRYYDALFVSPFGNDLLLDLTLDLIDDEKLGQHDVPDLVCISFSCNDYVGHSWGPDSQEVLDVTLRSDLVMQKLLERLDQRVGRGRYVVVVSADHGICPLPEASRLRGLDARRVPPGELTGPAERFIREKFAAPADTLCFQRFTGGVVLKNESIYLNQKWLREAGLDAAVVQDALAGWLRDQPAVASAWTATQLAAAAPPGSEIGKREWNSFYADRSGDVQIALKPYYLFATGLNRGTTHGSPYPYDTRVPLLVYGSGVRPAVRSESVTPLAAAAILAHSLGIAPPAKCDTPVPEGLFER
jgi:predicted AlkP superfamily pyrophosphatase or phosphodiesterase